jgi:hypothetical protein
VQHSTGQHSAAAFNQRPGVFKTKDSIPMLHWLLPLPLLLLLL